MGVDERLGGWGISSKYKGLASPSVLANPVRQGGIQVLQMRGEPGRELSSKLPHHTKFAIAQPPAHAGRGHQYGGMLLHMTLLRGKTQFAHPRILLFKMLGRMDNELIESNR